MSVRLLEGIFGPILARVVDTHQLVCEEKTKPEYETAIEILREGSKVLQMYPQENGMILKLVVDGKCERQVRAKIGLDGRLDHSSVGMCMTRLGFQENNGTRAMMKYFDTLRKIEVDGPTIVLENDDGEVCRFKILGGMWNPGKSKIRIWSDKFDETVDLEGQRAKELAAPFKIQRSVE